MNTYKRLRLSLGVLLTGVFMALSGCSGGSEGPQMECATSADCATGALCLGGECTECQRSAACEADGLYESQGLTQCRDGQCTSCAPGQVGCECVADSCTTGECVGGTCTDCDRGSVDCVCLDNGTCGAGATCTDENRCATCSPGLEACACRDDDTCDAGLLCTNGVCTPEPCQPGDQDCACDGGTSCGSNLYCDAMEVCRACTSDVPGCPCDAGSTCGGDNYCENVVCEACPVEDKPAQCGCTSSDQCLDGLVCDTGDFVCREPVTCSDLSCLPNQQCDVMTMGPNVGDAFCVPATCVSGYRWDSDTGACVPIPATPPATCQSLGCATQRRDCLPGTGTADATCGACQPGYLENGGACALDPAATCDGTASPSIASDCAARNQTCVPTAQGAYCGECLEGHASDPTTGRCVAVEACGESQCVEGQFCHYPQAGGPPECRDRCPAGQAMAEDGTCTACGALSCGDSEVHGALVEGQCACEAQVFCAYNADSGSRCRVNPCEPQQAVSTLGGACTACNVTCGNSDGEGSRVWPWRDQFGGCFCETEDDYYQPYGGSGTARACDADQDGWINETAHEAYEAARTGRNNVSDAATLANFRCARRTVDRIRLVNEYGQRRDVGLCGEGGDVLNWAPNDPPVECANGPTEVTLYENAQLDSATSVELDNTQFPRHGARKLEAAELNAMTKACVGLQGDFNRNGTADVQEEQPLRRSDVPAASQAELVFQAASYFVELHRGRYIAPGGGTGPGIYIVEEISRCEDGFPLTYDENGGSYWRGCARRRNADYDAGAAQGRVTMDFAQFGCSEEDGACDPLGPISTGRSVDEDEVIDHDVCALRTAGMLPLSDEPWRGMNHHSQFTCAHVGSGTGHHRVPRDLLNGSSAQPQFDFNQCAAVACSGESGCEASFTQGDGENQPRHPNVDCRYASGAVVSDDTVGFVSARYGNLTTAGYARGCINEAADWSGLCPGYTERPEAVLTSGNPADFGKLICSCGFEYGGRSCEFACPLGIDGDRSDAVEWDGRSRLHFGGPDLGLTGDQAAQYGCVGGFCSQHPPVPEEGFTGGRRGYWMCGGFTATRAERNDRAPVFSGTRNAQAVTVTGRIPMHPVTRVPMSSSAFHDSNGQVRQITAY